MSRHRENVIDKLADLKILVVNAARRNPSRNLRARYLRTVDNIIKGNDPCVGERDIVISQSRHFSRALSYFAYLRKILHLEHVEDAPQPNVLLPL